MAPQSDRHCRSMSLAGLVLLLSSFAGLCICFELEGHYSDISQMLLRGRSLLAQHQLRDILADEAISRVERNKRLKDWADDNNAQDTIVWFLQKEGEYDHHNMEVQARRPHESSRASRMIRKIAKCPHTTEREKMAEVPVELMSYRAEVQHILRTVYPSLQQKHVNVSQLRHEFAEDPFKEIEDKHRAILEIAVSKDKAPYHKRYHIERLIDESDEKVATILRIFWKRIPGVQTIHLNRRRRDLTV